MKKLLFLITMLCGVAQAAEPWSDVVNASNKISAVEVFDADNPQARTISVYTQSPIYAERTYVNTNITKVIRDNLEVPITNITRLVRTEMTGYTAPVLAASVTSTGGVYECASVDGPIVTPGMLISVDAPAGVKARAVLGLFIDGAGGGVDETVLAGYFKRGGSYVGFGSRVEYDDADYLTNQTYIGAYHSQTWPSINDINPVVFRGATVFNGGVVFGRGHDASDSNGETKGSISYGGTSDNLVGYLDHSGLQLYCAYDVPSWWTAAGNQAFAYSAWWPHYTAYDYDSTTGEYVDLEGWNESSLADRHFVHHTYSACIDDGNYRMLPDGTVQQYVNGSLSRGLLAAGPAWTIKVSATVYKSITGEEVVVDDHGNPYGFSESNITASVSQPWWDTTNRCWVVSDIAPALACSDIHTMRTVTNLTWTAQATGIPSPDGLWGDGNRGFSTHFAFSATRTRTETLADRGTLATTAETKAYVDQEKARYYDAQHDCTWEMTMENGGFYLTTVTNTNITGSN